MNLINYSYYSIPGLKPEPKQIEEPKVKFIPATQNIINLICETTEVTWEQITGSRGNDKILIARFLVCHFLLKYAGMSRAGIGRKINRGHDTVINALKKLNNMIKTNTDVAYQVDTLTKIIENK